MSYLYSAVSHTKECNDIEYRTSVSKVVAVSLVEHTVCLPSKLVMKNNRVTVTFIFIHGDICSLGFTFYRMYKK